MLFSYLTQVFTLNLFIIKIYLKACATKFMNNSENLDLKELATNKVFD